MSYNRSDMVPFADFSAATGRSVRSLQRDLRNCPDTLPPTLFYRGRRYFIVSDPSAWEAQRIEKKMRAAKREHRAVVCAAAAAE